MRRAVLEHGLDSSRQSPGTGKDGRLTKDDVMAAIASGTAAAAPASAAPSAGPAVAGRAPAGGRRSASR